MCNFVATAMEGFSSKVDCIKIKLNVREILINFSYFEIAFYAVWINYRDLNVISLAESSIFVKFVSLKKHTAHRIIYISL